MKNVAGSLIPRNRPCYGAALFMKTTKSQALFEAAQQVIPGGVNSPVRAFRSVGAAALLLVDERDQLVARDAVFLRGPVSPAVWRLDGRLELLARELCLLRAH